MCEREEWEKIVPFFRALYLLWWKSIANFLNFYFFSFTNTNTKENAIRLSRNDNNFFNNFSQEK